MILLLYIENLIKVSISSTYSQNDNLIVTDSYSGMRSALLVCMKHVTIQLIKEVDGQLVYVKASVPKWEVIHFGMAYVVKKYSK